MLPLILALALIVALVAGEWLLRRRARLRRRRWNMPPLPAPDPQAIRLVVLGDSIAVGYGLPPAQAWPALLEKRLQDTFPGQRYQVINASIAGHTVADAYIRFNEHVLAYRPHMVLIAFGINDCRRVWRMNDARRLQIFARHELSWWGRSYLLRTLINRLRPIPRATVVNETALAPEPRIPLDAFRHILRWLGRRSRGAGAQPVYLSLPPIQPSLEFYHEHEFMHWQQYSAAIRQLARSENVPFIELSHDFPSSAAWMPDGVHLAAAGQKIIADRVWAAMQRPPLAGLLAIPSPVSNAEMAPSLD